MATCKRCIHFDVCDEQFIDKYRDDGDYVSGVETECENFMYSDGRRHVETIDALSDTEVVEIAERCAKDECRSCKMYNQVCDEYFIDELIERLIAIAKRALPYEIGGKPLADMSDEECLKVFKVCCGKGYTCKACPLAKEDGVDACHALEKRVLEIAERNIS